MSKKEILERYLEDKKTKSERLGKTAMTLRFYRNANTPESKIPMSVINEVEQDLLNQLLDIHLFKRSLGK